MVRHHPGVMSENYPKCSNYEISYTVIDNIESSHSRSQSIVVDLRHRFTVIHMNEMNAFDQSEKACHSYL